MTCGGSMRDILGGHYIRVMINILQHEYSFYFAKLDILYFKIPRRDI